MRDPRRSRVVVALTASCVLMSFAAGCGSSEPGLVRVRGKVTLDGGSWPKGGTLSFTPTGGGDPSRHRPGSATFEPDGSFTVTSFEPGDGLFPGSYDVGVECQESAPTMANDGKSVGGKSLIPAKYQSPSTSGLKVTVEPNQGSMELALDVKTK